VAKSKDGDLKRIIAKYNGLINDLENQHSNGIYKFDKYFY